jgi:hypothetical protein
LTRSSLLVLFACTSVQGLTGCSHAPGADPAPVPGIAGTYEIEICRDSCVGEDAPHLLTRGCLVLDDTVYDWDRFPRAMREYLEKYESVLTVIRTQREPNACFVLGSSEDPDTYAGMSPVGVTKWLPNEENSLSVALFHSHDAGYVARLTLGGQGLRGRGRSWGAGDWHQEVPADVLHGRRIGAPDWGICIRAAEAQAAARP